MINLTRGQKRKMIGGNRPNSSPYDTILPPTGIDGLDAPSTNGIAMCHGGHVATTKRKGSIHE